MQNKFKIYLNSYVNGFARGTKKAMSCLYINV